MSKYALLLNNMQQPNIENIEVVKVADTRQELVDYHNSMLADAPWRDGQWGKAFKKGSALEWFNPDPLTEDNSYWGGIWEVTDAQVGQGLQKASSW